MKRAIYTYRKRRLADQLGRLAEFISLLYLRTQGWRILFRRKKTPFGEIDLICRRGNTILFVEVKYRRNQSDISQILPSPTSQTRLYRATQYIFSKLQHLEPASDMICLRFDIFIWTGFGRLKRYRNVALENTSWHFE